MIGVFGGTFDPVHFGHLRMALEAAEALAAESVRFVPCRRPPHRPPPRAGADDRLAMLRLGIAGQPGFVVDRREIDRPGPSYMVDTLASMRDESGDRPLALIVGGDAFLGLTRWHDWRRLLDLAHLLVLRRPGVVLPKDGELAALLRRRCVADPRGLSLAASGLVAVLPATQLMISATAVRKRIAAGGSVRYLMPDAVIDHIERRRLYRNPCQDNPAGGAHRHA